MISLSHYMHIVRTDANIFLGRFHVSDLIAYTFLFSPWLNKATEVKSGNALLFTISGW